MFKNFGAHITKGFRKYMPDSFVFALLLTLVTAICALVFLKKEPLTILSSWYQGFFDLLAFGMQIVLIIITGYSIALSPTINKAVDGLTRFIKTPKQVYFFVVLIGMLLSLVSFGWLVITSFLARALAERVKGVNYSYLIACVYFSMNSWVLGFSSSIPLLLNTEDNYLITSGVLNETIPTALTLGSSLNMAMIALMVIIAPMILLLLAPKAKTDDLDLSNNAQQPINIEEEANALRLPNDSVSDSLNNSMVLQYLIALLGVCYIVYHFITNGFDLNLNIMIFIFLMIGLLLHKTPMRYIISMKHASSNVSGVLFQYPFYAGIMGIMLYTGLGNELAQWLASVASIDNYPVFAFLTGGFVNFAIPSAGGEFAVVGPSIIEAVKLLGTDLPAADINAMIARSSLAIAYGETLSNMLQPFFLLLVMPIMAAGTKLQARDVMGYLLLPLSIFFVLQLLAVVFIPL